jgi:hypothetical protein
MSFGFHVFLIGSMEHGLLDLVQAVVQTHLRTRPRSYKNLYVGFERCSIQAGTSMLFLTFSIHSERSSEIIVLNFIDSNLSSFTNL